MLSNASRPQGQDLRLEFARFDKNHNGTLDPREFRHAVRRHCPLSEKEVKVLFRVFDPNGDGGVDIEEFVASVERGTPVWDPL